MASSRYESSAERAADAAAGAENAGQRVLAAHTRQSDRAAALAGLIAAGGSLAVIVLAALGLTNASPSRLAGYFLPAAAAFALPYITLRVLRLQGLWFRYLAVGLPLVVILVLHATAVGRFLFPVLVLPLVLSALYVDRRLIVSVGLLTIAGIDITYLLSGMTIFAPVTLVDGVWVLSAPYPELFQHIIYVDMGLMTVAGVLTFFGLRASKLLSELVDTRREMLYKDAFDHATGLPNRAYLLDFLATSIERTKIGGEAPVVLYISVAELEHLALSHGNEFKAALLRGLGKRLVALVRDEDVVASATEEHFVVLLRGSYPGADVALHTAERIARERATPIQVEGIEIHMDLRVGIARFPDHGTDAETLLFRSRLAMVHAREQLHTSVEEYSPILAQASQRAADIHRDLQGALERDELSVAYQLVIELETGRAMRAEALLRWQHPTMGFISPGEFIPIAEHSGLIGPIGQWVLRAACLQIARWRRKGLEVDKMAVNLSPVQLTQPDLVDQVRAALEGSGVPAGSIELEVTESAIAADIETTKSILDAIKGTGVGLAIDDFGIGYSSLQYLKELPVDTVKIDQSFVKDLTVEPNDACVVASVCALAHQLGLKVIAEGVEVREQVDFLLARRCDFVQGYYFHPPQAPSEVEDYLVRRPWEATPISARPALAPAPESSVVTEESVNGATLRATTTAG